MSFKDINEKEVSLMVFFRHLRIHIYTELLKNDQQNFKE